MLLPYAADADGDSTRPAVSHVALSDGADAGKATARTALLPDATGVGEATARPALVPDATGAGEATARTTLLPDATDAGEDRARPALLPDATGAGVVNLRQRRGAEAAPRQRHGSVIVAPRQRHRSAITACCRALSAAHKLTSEPADSSKTTERAKAKAGVPWYYCTLYCTYNIVGS